MTPDRSHQIVIVDSTRRDDFLRLWSPLLTVFRSTAKPGEHCTVAAIAVDASRVDTVLPSTPVADAPDSLNLPVLTAGSGPDDVAAQLLRIVVDAQVHLDEPRIIVHMLADPRWDRIRLADIRALPNVQIVSNALGSRRNPLQSTAAKVVAVVVLAAFVLVFLRWLAAPRPATPVGSMPSSTPSAPVVKETGWSVPAIQALQPDQCINGYPYPSALNKAPFGVVDCDSPDAVLRFLQSFPANEGAQCPSNTVVRSWVLDGSDHCFLLILRDGMCVPALRREDGRVTAWFRYPGACGDPFDRARIGSDDTGASYVDLVIDWTTPATNPRSCTERRYVIDDMGVEVCAHLR